MSSRKFAPPPEIGIQISMNDIDQNFNSTICAMRWFSFDIDGFMSISTTSTYIYCLQYLFIQISMDDVLEGYPPPKAVMDKKRHIFTTEDKTVADNRASQVHCKKPELARKDTYIGVWNQRNRFPNSNWEKTHS